MEPRESEGFFVPHAPQESYGKNLPFYWGAFVLVGRYGLFLFRQLLLERNGDLAVLTVAVGGHLH